MHCEESRLLSFTSWPVEAGTDPGKIAKAGFFYTGHDMSVECYFCGVVLSDWSPGERRLAVMARHRALSPLCPFVRDPTTTNNVPLGRPQIPASGPPAVPAFVSRATRVASFTNWPIPALVHPEDLATAGFYYTGHADRVECAFCGGQVESWEPGDEPLMEHRRHFPQCAHARRNSSTPNVQLRTPPPGLRLRNPSAVQSEEYDSLKWLGVATHRVPRSPKLSTYESRLRTFHHWPPAIAQSPHQLSDAGFYFTGQGDEVRCFHCDGGLRLWERGDEPWVEHARWFPDCSYVFLVRGQQFIDSCTPQQAPGNRLCPPSDEQSTTPVGEMVTEPPPPSDAWTNVRTVPRPVQRRLSEREIQDLMCSPVALSALATGLEVSVVKQALRRKVERTGSGFRCAEALIGAAVGLQVATVAASESAMHSDDEPWATPPDSPLPIRRGRAGSAVDALPPRVAPASPPPVPVPPAVSSSSPSATNVSLPLSNSSCRSISQLEDELRRLREWRQCKVCMDREVCVVLLPCGHLVTCAQCAHSLVDCPLCRAVIAATVRTFLS